jgi:biopolymer transport protein ExbB
MSEQLQTLWRQAIEIWLSGGWSMVGIAIIALVMFGLGMKVQVRLSETGFRSVPEKTWRRWIDHPAERKGPIGELMNFLPDRGSIKDISAGFEELQSTEIAPFQRDLRVMKVCVGAAPLLGLLGTVAGMLTTFNALGSGSGAEKTMGMVAGGISEALITTETGLVVALPGLFFHHLLEQNHERYKTFLAHLQTVWTQKIYREQKERSQAA